MVAEPLWMVHAAKTERKTGKLSPCVRMSYVKDEELPNWAASGNTVWRASPERVILLVGPDKLVLPLSRPCLEPQFTEETVQVPMTVDIVKQLDRAKRYIEKSRIDDAIEAYQALLEQFPNHLESIQALGDLYTRQNQQDRAPGLLRHAV